MSLRMRYRLLVLIAFALPAPASARPAATAKAGAAVKEWVTGLVTNAGKEDNPLHIAAHHLFVKGVENAVEKLGEEQDRERRERARRVVIQPAPPRP